MKKNTREEILTTAKRLFNERGYNSVSTRDIADALNISKGNLTYYFKKKEEIIEALLDEPSETVPPDAPVDLAGLDAFFLHIGEVVAENAFYFWHHAQLSQSSSNIHGKQRNIYRDNCDKLMQTMQRLRGNGLVREESYRGEYERIIDAIILAGIYWMPFSKLKQAQGPQGSYRSHAWAILYPLLTGDGKEKLRFIIEL